MKQFVYGDESYSIIGAALEVHNTLGPGFLEPVYQKALEIELKTRQIPFLPQVKLDISYKGIPLNKSYTADFIIYGKIIVEVKAISALTEIDMMQVRNYLKATQYQLGLLINFGESSLKTERVLLSQEYKRPANKSTQIKESSENGIEEE